MSYKIFSMGDPVVSKKTKLFLGDNSCHTNIQTYHDPKYPWLLESAEQLRSIGNWSKFEIDLSKEKTNFDEMDEVTRHIFESGLKFAICLDSCAGRAPLELFVNNGISNCPEWELYVTNHQNNELLHSESYTEMIRAIYNDVDVFINDIMKDEYVQKRATTILSAFDDATTIFDKMAANNISKQVDAESNIPYPEITEKAVKKAIYKSLMVINMFEGIRFFCTFATAWSFSEQPTKYMQGSSNIFKLIARDEMIHLDVIQKVINHLNAEEEEGFKEVISEMEDEVYDMFKTAYNEEMDWIKYLFNGSSPLIGMNESILSSYMDYIFTTRMTAIGLDSNKIGVYQEKNPLPWTKNYLDSTDIKTAPQEMESVSYIAAISLDNEEELDLDMI